MGSRTREISPGDYFLFRILHGNRGSTSLFRLHYWNIWLGVYLLHFWHHFLHLVPDLAVECWRRPEPWHLDGRAGERLHNVVPGWSRGSCRKCFYCRLHIKLTSILFNFLFTTGESCSTSSMEEYVDLKASVGNKYRPLFGKLGILHAPYSSSIIYERLECDRHQRHSIRK